MCNIQNVLKRNYFCGLEVEWRYGSLVVVSYAGLILGSNAAVKQYQAGCPYTAADKQMLELK